MFNVIVSFLGHKADWGL